MAWATGTKLSAPLASATSAAGVTARRLLVIGTPNSCSTFSQVQTSPSAWCSIFSRRLAQVRPRSWLMTPRSEMPMVTVRMSRCSLSTMRRISVISSL